MKKHINTIVAIVSVLIFVCLVGIYMSYSGDESSCSSPKVNVKYYYSPGCPHCRNFMAAWDEFASSAKASCQKINCAENSEACAGIRGVPHVVFSTDKNETVYSGERTSSGLNSFLERFSS